MDDLFERAEDARRAGRLRKALNLYKEYLKTSAGDPHALEAVAFCLHNLQQGAEARAVSISALEIDSELVLAHVVLAFAAYEEGDRVGGRREAETALRIGPQVPEALCCYGILLLEDGSSLEASKYLRKAIEVDPKMYLAHYNLIACYQNLRDAKAANAEIKTIFRLKPNPTNTIRVLVSLLWSNRLLYSGFLLAPFLMLWVHARILFVFHFFLILLYVGAGLVAMKERRQQLVSRNFVMAAIIAVLDVIIYIGSM